MRIQDQFFQFFHFSIIEGYIGRLVISAALWRVLLRFYSIGNERAANKMFMRCFGGVRGDLRIRNNSITFSD